MNQQLPAYALAYLREVDLNEQVVDYIQRIDATLAPYDGRFVVHGGRLVPAEGGPTAGGQRRKLPVPWKLARFRSSGSCSWRSTRSSRRSGGGSRACGRARSARRCASPIGSCSGVRDISKISAAGGSTTTL